MQQAEQEGNQAMRQIGVASWAAAVENAPHILNDVNAAQLSAEWRDPDSDPKVAAAYYARVIEIPTPRWTTYLAVRNNLPLTKARDAWLQERACTSPIYYSP
jgi:hypothetical protein